MPKAKPKVAAVGPEKPRTRLRFNELMAGYTMRELAVKVGMEYTRLYPYTREGANPTLLILERLAVGISELTGKKVTARDLIAKA